MMPAPSAKARSDIRDAASGGNVCCAHKVGFSTLIAAESGRDGGTDELGPGHLEGPLSLGRRSFPKLERSMIDLLIALRILSRKKQSPDPRHTVWQPGSFTKMKRVGKPTSLCFAAGVGTIIVTMSYYKFKTR